MKPRSPLRKANSSGVCTPTFLRSDHPHLPFSPFRYASIVWMCLFFAAPAHGQSIGELLDAYQRSQSEADAQRFVVATLKAQQDRDIQWESVWGDQVEQLRREGKLADAQWEEYLTHAVFLRCTFRRTVRADGPIPFSIREEAVPHSDSSPSPFVRRGDTSSSDFFTTISYQLKTATLNCDSGQREALIARDRPQRDSKEHVAHADDFWPREPFYSRLERYLHPEEAHSNQAWPTGPATVKLEWELKFTTYSRPSRTETHIRCVSFEGRIEIVNADASTVAVTVDPSLRERVTDSIRLDRLQADKQRPEEVCIPLHIIGRPVGLAFEVHLRQKSASWPVGTVASPDGEICEYRLLEATCPGIDITQPADVIFKPAARVGESTTHLFNIWGEDIIKSNVNFRQH